jgi:hypothetical protein
MAADGAALRLMALSARWRAERIGHAASAMPSPVYCETVPSIQISTGPPLPGDRFPPVPRPRSPAYAFVPLVILQNRSGRR